MKHPADDLLLELTNQDLSSETRNRISPHVTGCPTCATRLAKAYRLRSLLQVLMAPDDDASQARTPLAAVRVPNQRVVWVRQAALVASLLAGGYLLGSAYPQSSLVPGRAEAAEGIASRIQRTGSDFVAALAALGEPASATEVAAPEVAVSTVRAVLSEASKRIPGEVVFSADGMAPKSCAANPL